MTTLLKIIQNGQSTIVELDPTQPLILTMKAGAYYQLADQDGNPTFAEPTALIKGVVSGAAKVGEAVQV